VPSPRGALFRFLRYDLRLEGDWLAAELGETPGAREIADMRRLDDTASMPRLEALARRAADIQVLPAHWEA
jgi:uncharacterized protein